MAGQAKKVWENPIAKEHMVGLGIGIIATAIFCFGYPGWFMSRSAAADHRKADGDKIRAEYCLASYLSSGVSAADAAKVRSKGGGEQAEIFVNAGHAPDVDAGRACGRALDQLSTEAQIDGAIKSAMAAAEARTARIAAAKESGSKKN
ncbi:hypothetical protein [Reyranella sp. CPCC 100927]|uniref:hypothetical protein n=1 Tax=Reyranella sp. CPCC 100927 TaxID=2599616 RepID=UPI0011B3BA29|nr:hypothetical protein [Reyranella sp. CPCC 100927]TWS96326.1 hypothetical protein FQU96_39265 [Reyranella sp. CPCC 100927]